MTHQSGGRNSEVASPQCKTGNSRTAAPDEGSVVNRLLRRPRLGLAIFTMICAHGISAILDAQPPRRALIDDPDTYSVTPIPERTTDRISKLKDLGPSRTLSSKIQRTSSLEDPEGMQPQTPFQLDQPLAQVVIEGNKTIPDSEIAKHIKIRAGRPVTQKQIKDDVDALVRLRWFAHVEPKVAQTEEGLVLRFVVLERPIVRRVEYKGLKKVKQKVFDALTQLKPGSPFDIGSNRESARRIEEYYHEKGFAFATVELEKGNDRDDREVVFLINEGPKVHVSAVKFDGNKQFIDGILKTKTRTKTRILWLIGGKYDPTSIKDDIDGVKQYYHQLGYFDVDIQHQLKFSSDKSSLEIHYIVDEGIRSKIRNVEIVGNNVMTEDVIREMIKVERGTFYNATDINKDAETIKSKYGEQGRLFCQVNPINHWTEEPGVVDLEYRIDEDKVYRVRNINVHILGDHPHTKTNLVRNIATIQPGDLADPKKIHLFKRRLEGSQNFDAGQQGGVRVETNIVKGENWIDKSGYDVARSQTSEVRNKPRTKPRDAQVADAGKSLISTSPAPEGYFGMHGWIGTKPSRAESRDPFISVAARFDNDVKQLPNPTNHVPDPLVDDKLSPLTTIFRAQSKDPLQPPANFGFDNSPQGDPWGNAIRNPDPDDWERLPPPEFIDLDTYVSEARTGRLMFGVGVNSDAGLVGNIVLSEQNFDIARPPTSWSQIADGTAFRGGGQKFKIEAMPGTQVSRYMIDWQDPYFLDSNFNLGVSGFYFTRYYRNWYENRIGGRIRVGRQITQRWQSSFQIRLEDVDLYNAPTVAPAILKQALGYNLLSTVRGSIIHDTRDAAFNTSQGHYFELAYEQAFGTYNYPRFEVEARQYFTIYRRVDGQGKHTLMVRAQAGYTGGDTPIFERFFAGGFQTFRGFAFRGVSPVDTGVYVGGDFMLLGGAEYQMPVTANEMIKVVGFTDFGTINDQVSLSNFRLSVGAGFRVSIPMMGPVPIALDFAVPVLHQSTDVQQIFSFYVGMNR